MHNEVGITSDRRREVRISGRGEREVALVHLGVAGLREGAQHEVAEDALFRLAFDARGEFLVHARGDGDVLWHFVLAGIAALSAGFAALTAGNDTLDGKRSETKRITEAGGELFELDDAARVGLLVNAVKRGDAEILKPGGNALVGGEHEFLNQAIGPGALGAGDAAHLAVLVELDDRLGQIEVDGAALFTAPIHEDGEFFHPLKFRNQRGIAGAHFRVALNDGVNLCISHARGGTDDAFDDFEALDIPCGIECMMQLSTRRSSLGRRLQMPVDSS